MRRRAVRRVRRPRPKNQWLNGIGPIQCSETLRFVDCADVETPAQLDTNFFLLVDNPLDTVAGQVSTVGEATLLRLVGEILFDASFAVSSAPATWWDIVCFHWGIFLTDQDNVGTIRPLTPTFDLESKDWLASGTYTFANCGPAGQSAAICFQNDATGGGVTQSNASHIDVKVKRKIRREESIILAVDVMVDHILGDVGAYNMRINGKVRALIQMP